MLKRTLLLALLPSPLLAASQALLRLDQLDCSATRQSWGAPKTNRSVLDHPLTIAGQKFEHGLGTPAASRLRIDLPGQTASFSAAVGLDDDSGSDHASVVFEIVGDKKLLWSSGVMHW